MASPNNRGDGALRRHLTPSSKTFSASNGLHLVELMVKGAQGNLQTSQTIAKAISYFPQADGKDL